MSNHVFICYADGNVVFACKLADSLTERGVPVWLEMWDLPYVDDREQFIENTIRDCAQFLLVLSEKVVSSPEVHRKLRTALDEKKPIIPVMLRSCRIPEELRNIQYVDFTSCGPGKEVALNQLVRRLGFSTDGGEKSTGLLLENPVATIRKIAREEDRGSKTRLASGQEYRDRLQGGTQGPEMVVIPAGTFKMGDTWYPVTGVDGYTPVHTVHIWKPFALGKYPVTFEEYDKFATATGREHGWGRGRRAVFGVSWEDARAYAKWLSGHTGKRYRLPTEAEWEYAARSGGRDEVFAGTSNSFFLVEYAWFRFNTGFTDHLVGQRKPSALGLYDMSGNVWEWTSSLYQSYPYDADDGRENPEATGARVLRGGSCSTNPEALCTSYRHMSLAGERGGRFGFRLARDIDFE